MKTHRDIITEKHAARLAKLPANSGHAKVLRAKLGISPVVEAVPAPAPVTPKKKKKKASNKKNQ